MSFLYNLHTINLILINTVFINPFKQWKDVSPQLKLFAKEMLDVINWIGITIKVCVLPQSMILTVLL